MARQAAVIAVVMLLGLGSLAGLVLHGRDSEMTAGFWFEITPAAVESLDVRMGPITHDDLNTIASVARTELGIAFSNTRLQLSDSRSADYRVRVVPRLDGIHRFPIAGGSRSLGGRRGHGAVNFITVASTAISYAPAGTPRNALIQSIGRGVGRTAAHEFAHQILADFLFDTTTDRLSYEFADLRAEHFYGELHWGIAAGRLQERIGLAAPER